MARERTTHTWHACQGSFPGQTMCLPTKTKGNCKSMKKHLMMKITSYDVNNILWWKWMGQAAPAPNWVSSCRAASSTLYRYIVYNKIYIRALNFPECPSKKSGDQSNRAFQGWFSFWTVTFFHKRKLPALLAMEDNHKFV